MATNFPTSLDNGSTLPEPTTGATIPAADDTNRSQAIKAVQAKVGIGASTPTDATVLKGTAAGTSAWGQVEIDEIDATGTPNSSNFLRGDGAWADPGGGDLLAANNLSDLASAATSRTNLGVDAAGTDNAPAASTTTAGKVEVATQTEVNTGTDTSRVVTPSTLANYTGLGGGAFDMLKQHGLAAWFKADGITGLSDTDAVSTWADSAGSGYSLDQATGAAQPAYRTSIQNSLPVVRFDGTDDVLVSDMFNIGQTYTIFVAYANRAGGNGTLFSNQQSNAPIQRETQSWYHSSAATITTSSLNSGNLYVARFDYDSDNYMVRLDGVTQDSENASVVVNSDELVIGARSGTSEFLDGDICEIAVFNRWLSINEIETIETNLTSKWGF